MPVTFDQHKVNICGHRQRLFTSSWPGRILGLAGVVLRLVGWAGPGQTRLGLRLYCKIAIFVMSLIRYESTKQTTYKSYG